MIIRFGTLGGQYWKNAILDDYWKISDTRFDAELRFLQSMDERIFGNSFCPKISNFLFGEEIVKSEEIEVWINKYGVHVFRGRDMMESISCELSHKPSATVENGTVTVEFEKLKSSIVFKFDSDEALTTKMILNAQLDDWRYLKSGKKDFHLTDAGDEIANFGEGSSGAR